MTARFTDLSKGQMSFHTDLATGCGNCPIWEKPQSTFCPEQADYLLLLQTTHFSKPSLSCFHVVAGFSSLSNPSLP